MKHAIIILAHKDIPLLCKIIQYFDRECDIFVHIDKKAKIIDTDLKKISELKNIKKISRKYSIHWGGFSILKAELYLLNLVLRTSDANYIHLISGQDYPVKPLHEFLDFFQNANEKNYLSVQKMSFKEVTNRLLYFQPYDWVERNTHGRNFIKKIVRFQKKMKLQRGACDLFATMYHGSQWFSITRATTNFILNYTKEHPTFYKRMKFTFAPEECYINTLLMHFKSNECVDSNFRYIRWMYENGNNPANLTINHLGEIIESGAFFARKMEHPYCDILISAIDKYLLKKEDYSEILCTGAWTCRSLNKYSIDEALALAIAKFYTWAELQSALDMGCGCGLYVDFLRRYHVAISGYDGNPNTQELSSLILGSEMPCDVADLTEEIACEDDIPFDLVMCLDVLPYIPKEYEETAVDNLVKLCGKFLIIHWADNGGDSSCYANLRPANYIVDVFAQRGLKLNTFTTNFLREKAENEVFKKSLFVFEKHT